MSLYATHLVNLIKFVKGVGEMGRITMKDMGKFKELYETAKQMRIGSFIFKENNYNENR